MGILAAISIVSAGIGLFNSISNTKSRETNYMNQHFSYLDEAENLRSQAKGYEQRADDAAANAEINFQNAESTIGHGQNIFTQMTEAHQIQKEQMGTQLGGTRTAVGRSSVEHSGSTRRLIAENAVKMTRDLRSMQRTAGNQWDKLMAERGSMITSAHNLLQQEKTYDSIAGDYRDRAGDYTRAAWHAYDEAAAERTWWPFD